VISLRQHAISLAAVFLALAIGVVLGSGLLSDTLLSGLRDEKRQLQDHINTLDEQKNQLNQKLKAADDFDSAMATRMVHNALAEKSVVIFRTPDASDDAVTAVSRLIGDAGGTIVGTVSLTQQFVDANASEKLLSVVNSSILPAGSQLSTRSVDQGSQAGDLMGIVLELNRNPGTPPVDDTQRQTALAALRDTGFISYDKQITAGNAAIVITGGHLADDAGNRGSTVARFAAALAPHGSGTVLAGASGSSTGTAAVAVTRADQGMASAVTTVDNVEAESGRITAVLALQELIGGGRNGSYGTGQGATAVTIPQ
jgi:Copper transport outer membrane protein, MctB